MPHYLLIASVIFYTVAFFTFTKFMQIQRKLKNMIKWEVKCTDYFVRRTYQKKYYSFYFEGTYKKEEFNVADKTILPFFKNYFKIQNIYSIYLDPNNLNNYVTPLELIFHKIYLVLTIILIILPFIL